MLQEIGLTSLQLIERGSVRIEKNDYLCGADKIDWTLICNNTSQDEHYIAVSIIFRAIWIFGWRKTFLIFLYHFRAIKGKSIVPYAQTTVPALSSRLRSCAGTCRIVKSTALRESVALLIALHVIQSTAVIVLYVDIFRWATPTTVSVWTNVPWVPSSMQREGSILSNKFGIKFKF